jgi:dTMP kinase
MSRVKRGVLISFEGVEGSGKTTQAQALAAWLEAGGLPYRFVREPGMTPIGEKIRGLLLDPSHLIHPQCELLLFLAARSQLVRETILPALEAKQIVVADRFTDSTTAYQVYGRGLPPRLVAIFNRFAASGLKPDLTFLVDIDANERHARGKDRDRMEREDESYHQRVRAGYLKLAHRAKKRVRIIDGRQPADNITHDVIGHVKTFLINKGYQP